MRSGFVAGVGMRGAPFASRSACPRRRPHRRARTIISGGEGMAPAAPYSNSYRNPNECRHASSVLMLPSVSAQVIAGGAA
jgi:hypothetical protein